MMSVLVMKFGGSVLDTPQKFAYIAEIISEKKQQYDYVVVVVSAMGGLTNTLIKLANQVAKHPEKREVDMLISVGERISMSLLAMALKERKIKAISLTGSQSGIITSNRHLNAQIITVQSQRIQGHLEEGNVVVVAGFQGISIDKEITTLGRGGADTSAVALGVALKAKWVEFYKDVEGIYAEDPKKNSQAKLLKKLNFNEALAIQGPLHPRSIVLASKNSLPLLIKTCKKELWLRYPGTWVKNATKLQTKPIYEKTPLN